MNHIGTWDKVAYEKHVDVAKARALRKFMAEFCDVVSFILLNLTNCRHLCKFINKL